MTGSTSTCILWIDPICPSKEKSTSGTRNPRTAWSAHHSVRVGAKFLDIFGQVRSASLNWPHRTFGPKVLVPGPIGSGAFIPKWTVIIEFFLTRNHLNLSFLNVKLFRWYNTLSWDLLLMYSWFTWRRIRREKFLLSPQRYDCTLITDLNQVI